MVLLWRLTEYGEKQGRTSSKVLQIQQRGQEPSPSITVEDTGSESYPELGCSEESEGCLKQAKESWRQWAGW